MRFLYLVFCLVCVLNYAEEPTNQVECSAEIKYTVEKSGELEDISFITVKTIAENEDQARQSLTEKTGEASKKALEDCRQKHQDISGCVAKKLQSVSHAFEKLSSQSRKAL
ncbi:MAG: hypothetical protein NZT61_05085, partial [Deltaproteobacteria bacterium]|nr:hypothetical protein [Deltaproteobacteria bacterium]